MKRTIFILSFLSIAISMIAAQPASLPSASGLLQPSLRREPGEFILVVDTGKGSRPVLKSVALDTLVSGSAAQAGAQSGALAVSDKALRIEALAFLPAPAGSAVLAFSEQAKRLALILGSVGTMAGTEYWSASRGRMRVLYEEAYRIESPSLKTKLPDPADLPVAPGSSKVFYAFLRDLTFGGNVMQYQVRMGVSHIAMANENASAMKYYLIPLVQPGGMKTSILIVPCEEGLIVHFLSTIDASDIAAKRVFESAGNKSLAILGWFARQTAAAGLTRVLTLPVNIENVERLK
ncbi:MAG: hypothetical protein Q8O15_05980 [Rectinemataceae bacterium]|nr:hypothetical protein [Rectinemataceae bacterium]